MKKSKQIWFNERIITMIKDNSLTEGLNHSEYVEKCIYFYNNKRLPTKKIKDKLTQGQFYILSMMSIMSHDTEFTISRFEKMVGKGFISLPKRQIRDIIPKLLDYRYIKQAPILKNRNNKYKFYMVTKRGINHINKHKGNIPIEIKKMCEIN